LAACPSMNIESKTPKPNEARLQRHANRTSRRISWDLKLVTSRYHRTTN
jgi:hypothetical protein